MTKNSEIAQQMPQDKGHGCNRARQLFKSALNYDTPAHSLNVGAHSDLKTHTPVPGAAAPQRWVNCVLSVGSSVLFDADSVTFL